MPKRQIKQKEDKQREAKETSEEEKRKKALRIVSAIFAIFAIVHFVRLLTGFEVVFAGVEIPLWFNSEELHSYKTVHDIICFEE